MTAPVLSAPSPYRGLIHRLLDTPQLVQELRALPGPKFAALVQHLGVEDAGELIALATTEQLVAAFDEDLFQAGRPGERETFAAERFVTWLEVLLEAGEQVAARRIAELSPDFVVQALSSLVLVLDHDALLARLSEGGRAAYYADKALESALCEELEGYLIIARQADGWDAVLALLLALDRDHRPLLERLLDRCAYLARGYLDDLEGLHEVLSAADSLAEDVEAEREERRTQQGYVEPRAARAFLALCQKPLPTGISATTRDPLTAAYFRDRQMPGRPPAQQGVNGPRSAGNPQQAESNLAALLPGDEPSPAPPRAQLGDGATTATAPLVTALQRLHEEDPLCAGERMDELGYLANVLVAGAAGGHETAGRMRPLSAAEAVLATVALGAELAAEAERAVGDRRRASPPELLAVLRRVSADVLFRGACSALAQDPGRRQPRLLHSADELAAILSRRAASPKPARPR